MNKFYKDKYVIFLKFYNTTWKPYFTDNNFIHCYDYEYAQDLFNKLCKNFKSSEWLLVKIENIYSQYKFKYIKKDD